MKVIVGWITDQSIRARLWIIRSSSLGDQRMLGDAAAGDLVTRAREFHVTMRTSTCYNFCREQNITSLWTKSILSVSYLFDWAEFSSDWIGIETHLTRIGRNPVKMNPSFGRIPKGDVLISVYIVNVLIGEYFLVGSRITKMISEGVLANSRKKTVWSFLFKESPGRFSVCHRIM